MYTTHTCWNASGYTSPLNGYPVGFLDLNNSNSSWGSQFMGIDGPLGIEGGQRDHSWEQQESRKFTLWRAEKQDTGNTAVQSQPLSLWQEPPGLDTNMLACITITIKQTLVSVPHVCTRHCSRDGLNWHHMPIFRLEQGPPGAGIWRQKSRKSLDWREVRNCGATATCSWPPLNPPCVSLLKAPTMLDDVEINLCFPDGQSCGSFLLLFLLRFSCPRTSWMGHWSRPSWLKANQWRPGDRGSRDVKTCHLHWVVYGSVPCTLAARTVHWWL